MNLAEKYTQLVMKANKNPLSLFFFVRIVIIIITTPLGKTSSIFKNRK